MHPCDQIWQSDGASGKKVSFFSMEANTSISMSRQLILKWANFGSLTPCQGLKGQIFSDRLPVLSNKIDVPKVASFQINPQWNFAHQLK